MIVCFPKLDSAGTPKGFAGAKAPLGLGSESPISMSKCAVVSSFFSRCEHPNLLVNSSQVIILQDLSDALGFAPGSARVQNSSCAVSRARHVLSQDLFLGDEIAKSGSNMTSPWHTAGLGACDIARWGTSWSGRWEGHSTIFPERENCGWYS